MDTRRSWLRSAPLRVMAALLLPLAIGFFTFASAEPCAAAQMGPQAPAACAGDCVPASAVPDCPAVCPVPCPPGLPAACVLPTRISAPVPIAFAIIPDSGSGLSPQPAIPPPRGM